MDDDKQLKAKLKEIWATSNDWEIKPTTIDGIFIVKFPQKEIYQPQIGMKFKKTRHPMEGYFIRSKKEILLFRDLLNHKEIFTFFHQMTTDRQLQKSIELLEYWHQISTPVLGISFTKMKDRFDPSGIPALAINPVNDLGKTMRRKNLFIRNIEELKKYRLLFNNEKLDRLSRIIDEVNDEISFEIRVAQSKIKERYK
jgi:hypothetical protein